VYYTYKCYDGPDGVFKYIDRCIYRFHCTNTICGKRQTINNSLIPGVVKDRVRLRKGLSYILPTCSCLGYHDEKNTIITEQKPVIFSSVYILEICVEILSEAMRHIPSRIANKFRHVDK